MKNILILTILLALAASGLLAVSDARAAYTRGWVDATVTRDLPYRVPLAGVNAALTLYDDVPGELEAIRDAGFYWVRQTFPWGAIEPARGAFKWEAWDRIVSAAAQVEGIALVAVLDGPTPAWARTDLAPDHAYGPPEQAADFGAFAGAFAHRYGDRIDVYQIWDEPNLSAHWGGLEPKPADYAAILRAAYEAIHDADAEADVIAAGLAPTVERGPVNYSDVLYLRALYENGAAPYFDAAAGKPYGFETGPDDRRVHENLLNFSRAILLREIMVAHGDAQKALWGSHFGWNDYADSLWGQVTEGEKVRYIQGAYRRALTEWPWMSGLILQSWEPDAPPDDALWGFGFVPGSVPEIPHSALIPGRHPAAHPAITYAGEWEFGELGADIGQGDDSELRFTYAGEVLAFDVRRDNYRAYLYVTVNGEPANLLPRSPDGRAILVLTSEDLQPHTDLIRVHREAGDEVLSVHVEADRGWDQWALAGFAVGTPPDTRPYDFAAGVLLAVGAVMAVLWIRAARRLGGGAILEKLAGMWARSLLSDAARVLMAGAASLLVLLGAIMTWGGILPNIIRRDPPAVIAVAASAGILYWSPWLLLTLAAAAILFFLIYQRIELGLALVIFWTPFFALTYKVDVAGMDFSMSEICALMTFGAWVLRGLIKWARCRQNPDLAQAKTDKMGENHFSRPLTPALPPARGGMGGRPEVGRDRGGSAKNANSCIFRFHMLDAATFAVFAAAVLALPHVTYRAEALRELRTIFFEPFLFYVMVRAISLGKRDVLRLIDALMLAGLAVAVIGLFGWITQLNVITAEGGSLRLASVYGSPNNVALFLGRCLPLAMAFGLLGKRADFLRERRRALYALSGVVMLIAFGLTLSSGGLFLGLPAAAAVILLLWRGRRALLYIAGLMAAGLAALIPLSRIPRFANLFDLSTGTTAFRIHLWRSSLAMLRDHLIAGVGPDQFLYLYRGRYILPAAWQEPNLNHPHNVILDHWLRLGIWGLLAGIWQQVLFWVTALRVWRREADPVFKAVIAGIIGGMAYTLAHGLVDNSVFLFDLAYVFALQLAIIARLDMRGQAKD